jgi:Zn-dependent protease
VPASRSLALRLRAFGVPVEVDASFFVVIALLGWGAGSARDLAIWVAVALGAVLWHEVGHAVAARLAGSPAAIRLYGFGGLTSHRPLSPARTVVVAAAGPAAGLLAGAVLWWFRSRDPLLSDAADTALLFGLWTTIGWSVLNLAPILPLDGGHIARYLFETVTGRDGAIAAHRLSLAATVLLGIAALATGWWFSVLFLVLLGGTNLAALRELTDQPLREELGAGERRLLAGDTTAALAAADAVLARKPGASAYRSAVLLRGWALLRAGRAGDAREALRRLPPDAPAPGYLTGAIALADGQRSVGLAQMIDELDRNGSPPGALAVLCLAEHGLVREFVQRARLLDGAAPETATAAVRAALTALGRPQELD